MKRLWHSLIAFKPINDRLCKIRLTLISAYVPTKESENDEKIEFCYQLERVLLNAILN